MPSPWTSAARLQVLCQVTRSCRLVGAHLWHRSPVVSRQQWDLNPGLSDLACLRQVLRPAELPLTGVGSLIGFLDFYVDGAGDL